MLNRLVLFDNHHVRNICIAFQGFYNKKRPHQGIGGVIPFFPDFRNENKPDIENLGVIKSLELNGLVTHFKLAA